MCGVAKRTHPYRDASQRVEYAPCVRCNGNPEKVILKGPDYKYTWRGITYTSDAVYEKPGHIFLCGRCGGNGMEPHPSSIDFPCGSQFELKEFNETEVRAGRKSTNMLYEYWRYE